MKIDYAYRGLKKTFHVDAREVVIGRRQQGIKVDLALDNDDPDLCDRKISRPHAQISLDDNNQYWIEDLGSKHGTVVDGKNIQGQGPTRVNPGTPIRMGDSTLRIVESDDNSRQQRPLSLALEIRCLPVFNYSLHLAGIPFFSSVRVLNEGNEPNPELSLRIRISDFAETEPIAIPPIPADASFPLKPLPKWVGDAELLSHMPDAVTVPLQAYCGHTSLPLKPAIEVQVLPKNAWYSQEHEEVLASLIMPESDAVKEVVKRAHFQLRRLVPGIHGFADLGASAIPSPTETALEALYKCLLEDYRISYELEPRTHASNWQKVRFQDEVVDELQGTCVDLALLLAACLEAVHCDPLILLVQIAPGQSHALVGCWHEGMPRTKGEHKAQFGIALRNEARIRTWIDTGQLLVVDPTGFSRSKTFPEGRSFLKTKEHAKDYMMGQPVLFAVDVVAAREAGIIPMPLGTSIHYGRSASRALYRAKREAKRRGSSFVGCRHLLLGLLALDEGLMTGVFRAFGESVPEQVAKAVAASLPKNQKTQRMLPETDQLRIVKRNATEFTRTRSSAKVTEADLAKALLETSQSVARILKEDVGLSTDQCLSELNAIQNRPVVDSCYENHPSFES